jgi:tetratricopeptide (TPR) repeat protein
MTEATPRNTDTIRAEGTSIADVRRDARSRIPKGWYACSERTISDGKSGTATAEGETEEAALRAARASLPDNAVDPEPTTRQQADTQTVTVAAATEEAARSQAAVDVGGCHATARKCVLTQDGRKGVLGIGKRLPQFTVEVRRPAIVDVKYGTPTIIELMISDALPSAEHYRKRYENGEFDEVIDELSSALDSLAPDSEHRKVLSSTCSDRGGAMCKRGKFTQALADFEMAVRANPQNWRALVNLSTVYLHNKRLDEARASLEKAIEINPSLSSNAQVTSQLNRLRSQHS